MGIGLLKSDSLVKQAIFIALIFFIAFQGLSRGEQNERIISINVSGNQRIEDSTILAKVKSKVDDYMVSSFISNDVKSIFSLGFFNDVKVEADYTAEGVKITFVVEEKPTVRGVSFEGNKVLDNDKLKEESTIIADSILNRSEIENTIKKIRVKYQGEGYYLAEIDYRLRPLPRNSVEVVFRLKEGNKVVLKKLYFQGNKSFSDEELKKILKTREDWLFGWATEAGDFNDTEFKTDMQRIDSFYQDNGFIEVDISEPDIEMSSDRAFMYITVQINEGRQFTVGKLEIEGNTLLSDEDVANVLGFRKGSVFSRGKLEKGIADLSDFYSQKGYLFSDIVPVRNYHKDLPIVNLNVSIEKGEKFYIGKIDIKGNTKTRDNVVRRELSIREGDQANSLKLRQSREDAFQLGYFEDVKIKTKRGSQRNLLDVQLDVEEKPTGTLTFGGGYSSAEQIVGMVSVSEENLFGKGWKASLSGQFSARTTEFDLSFADPYFLDRNLLAGIDLYNTKTEDFSNNDYVLKRTGGRLKFGWMLYERFRANIFPSIQETDTSRITSREDIIRSARRTFLNDFISGRVSKTDLKDDLNRWRKYKNSIYLKELEKTSGASSENSIYMSVSRTTYNNPIFPTNGSNFELSYEPVGGFLGGDVGFYRMELDASYYYPWKWGTSWHVRGLLGYVDGYFGDEEPIYERFKLGGSKDLRGYKEQTIGPKDRANEDWNLGGNKEIVLNLEYIVPILPNQFQLVLFYDMGNAVGNGQTFPPSNMKKSVGIGARLALPIGPVRLDLGYALDEQKGESPMQFHFGVGGSFF